MSPSSSPSSSPEKLSAQLRALAHALDVWSADRVLGRRIDDTKCAELAEKIEACEYALGDMWCELDWLCAAPISAPQSARPASELNGEDTNSRS